MKTFDKDGEIIIGETAVKEIITVGHKTQAVPFGASDYALLLHCLIDNRVAAQLHQMRNVRSVRSWMRSA